MSNSATSPVTICSLLWCQPGTEAELSAYEDAVLALIPAHSGTVLQRAVSDGTPGSPREVHVCRFPGEGELKAYLDDPRRTELSGIRTSVLARTESFRVSLR